MGSAFVFGATRTAKNVRCQASANGINSTGRARMDSPKRKRRLWWLLLIPFVLIVCIMGGFVAWLYFPAGPMTEAQPYLASDDAVEVVAGDWLTFRPKGQNPDTGLIFYPGARIDPQAYAPAAHQ